MKKIILLLLISFNIGGAGTKLEQYCRRPHLIKLTVYMNKLKSIFITKNMTNLLSYLKLAKEDLGTRRADIYNLLGFSYRKLDNPELDKSLQLI